MLLLLEEELFSFTLPLPLSFLYADSARQKMARSQKEQNIQKEPMIFPTFHSKGGGVKARIINKLPEH